MSTKDKGTEIFCGVDNFYKFSDVWMAKYILISGFYDNATMIPLYISQNKTPVRDKL